MASLRRVFGVKARGKREIAAVRLRTNVVIDMTLWGVERITFRVARILRLFI